MTSITRYAYGLIAIMLLINITFVVYVESGISNSYTTTDENSFFAILSTNDTVQRDYGGGLVGVTLTELGNTAYVKGEQLTANDMASEESGSGLLDVLSDVADIIFNFTKWVTFLIGFIALGGIFVGMEIPLISDGSILFTILKYFLIFSNIIFLILIVKTILNKGRNVTE